MITPRFFVSYCLTHGGIVSPGSRLSRCPVPSCNLALNQMPRAQLRQGIGQVLDGLVKRREREAGKGRARRSQAKMREEKEREK